MIVMKLIDCIETRRSPLLAHTWTNRSMMIYTASAGYCIYESIVGCHYWMILQLFQLISLGNKNTISSSLTNTNYEKQTNAINLMNKYIKSHLALYVRMKFKCCAVVILVKVFRLIQNMKTNKALSKKVKEILK